MPAIERTHTYYELPPLPNPAPFKARPAIQTPRCVGLRRSRFARFARWAGNLINSRELTAYIVLLWFMAVAGYVVHSWLTSPAVEAARNAAGN